MMNMTKNKITGYALIALAAFVLVFVAYKNTPAAQIPIVFSEKGMLDALWKNYKTEYIEEGTGRALDKQQDNITTSEGQSYTMLRSAWTGDKETFDLAFKWTNENLKRREDSLYSWLFGRKADGSYGVLTERGGYNSATDADIDMAVALIFAHNRWNEDDYLAAAKNIIKDIWAKEVVEVKGTPYLAANNLEKFSSQKPIINPSYFAPYAFRMFAEVDPAHDWMGVVDSSYALLERTASSTLDKPASAGLPPDWVVLNKTTGEPEATNISNLTTNFSYDALRTPWRIALDYMWFKEPRAKEYLDKLSFLSREWEEKRSIGSVYGHDGSVIAAAEVPAMYGGVIGYFLVSDSDAAKEIYEEKLKFLFSQDANAWKSPLSYYDSNWAWFGMALYNNQLPDLSGLDVPKAKSR